MFEARPEPNYSQETICPCLSKQHILPIFLCENQNGRHYGECKNCQKILIQAFECLQGRHFHRKISKKHALIHQILMFKEINCFSQFFADSV